MIHIDIIVNLTKELAEARKEAERQRKERLKIQSTVPSKKKEIEYMLEISDLRRALDKKSKALEITLKELAKWKPESRISKEEENKLNEYISISLEQQRLQSTSNLNR